MMSELSNLHLFIILKNILLSQNEANLLWVSKKQLQFLK